jgi:putative addiction module component (TIGR02574 family)
MMDITELIEKALHLTHTDWSYLASKLLESLDEDDQEFSEECKIELSRRLKEIDDGTAVMIPHAEVMANARARLMKNREDRASKAS